MTTVMSTVLLDRHRQSSYYIPFEPREHQETVAPAECMHSVTNFWEPVVIAACHAASGRHARYRYRGLLGCAFVISAAARRLGIAKPGTVIQLSVEFGDANARPAALTSRHGHTIAPQHLACPQDVVQ